MQGSDAIPELLDAWESDKRFTRTTDFLRYSSRSGNLPRVQSIAERIVQHVLDARFDTVKDARSYWRDNKGRSPAERWYHTLLDDTAGREQWTNAAENIVENESWRRFGGMTMTRKAAPGKKLDLKLRGEELRSKTGPSIMELFTQRAEELSESGTPGSQEMWSIRAACRMALAADRWEAKQALPLLQAQYERALAFTLASQKKSEQFDYTAEMAGSLNALTLARVEAGDAKTAYSDYFKFLAAIRPGDLDHDFHRVLEPIWRYPNDPASRQIAEKLFSRDGSAWNPILQRTHRVSGAYQVLTTPLLGSEPFREQVLEQLADESVAGIFLSNPESAPRAAIQQIQGEGEEGFYRVQDGWVSHDLDWGQGALRVDSLDPLAPPDGKEIEVRVCDVYAAALSNVRGLPWYGFYWSLEKREVARREMIDRLRRYGARYAYRDDIPGLRLGPPSNPAMVFPTLDHPATAKDVAHGRAIFSLDEKQERRTVTGLEFPIQARWTTLKDRPLRGRAHNNETGQLVDTIVYDNRGLIWQAEEILIDGQWRRFYGFVGRHTLSKVPADEIELIERRN